MRWMHTLWMLVTVMFAATSVHAVEQVYVFPPVEADNLLEKRYVLPQDFDGKPTVAILAYERAHQDMVDPWLAKFDALQDDLPTLRVYELPTVDRMTMLGRWWLKNAMRSGIKDIGQRARTITLHLEDRKGFVKKLGVTNLSIIDVLLLGDDGRVLARQRGKLSDEKWGKMVKAIQGFVMNKASGARP